jgi:hypothetical protein
MDVDHYERPSRLSRRCCERPSKMLSYIKAVQGEHDQKFVVVGHHAPSPFSIHPIYDMII